MKNFEELAFEWYDTICFSDKYAYRTEKMNAIKHLVSFFGKMNCEAIKSADVDRFIKYESEHLNPNNGKPFSKKIMIDHISIGNNIFEYALDNEMIDCRNPFQRKRKRIPKNAPVHQRTGCNRTFFDERGSDRAGANRGRYCCYLPQRNACCCHARRYNRYRLTTTKMKKRVITASAVVFLLIGAVLLIAPRISNQIGKQEAQTAIEQFEELKRSIESTSAATNPTDETQPDERDSKSGQAEVHGVVEHGVDTETRTVVYHIDADRLYRDSIAYNEKLKTHQYDLLINEHSYQKASLDLYDYGVPNNIYGYISATSIDMELPIYLGASEDNMAVGAAHLTNTSLPIGGKSTNCVLAAHTGYIGRVFFDYIRYLNIGDKITITNFWDTLSYRVSDKQIYKKYESSNCYITDGKDLLTLITCAHGGADRYYVLCERVDNLSTY